ncbi:fibronectin type III domain-containing protein [Runella sp.]|uniref:fibronectin type III domain-containing protein n=1 Tax=Runella sp. TaxID=1960881 RepID=UPI003D10AB89
MKIQVRILTLLILIVCNVCSGCLKPFFPPCPSDWGQRNVTANSIEITWAGVGKISGYRIYRDGNVVAELPRDATSYVDKNLKSKTMYLYKVKPYTGDHESEDCGVTGIITL